MIRLGKLLLLVAAIQPAVCEDARKREDATTGSGISMPSGREPGFDLPSPHEGAQVMRLYPPQITISAIHQPPAALATQTGRVSRGIAVYEVVACGSGTPRVKLLALLVMAEVS